VNVIKRKVYALYATVLFYLLKDTGYGQYVLRPEDLENVRVVSL
jgi:hypothetical protein